MSDPVRQIADAVLYEGYILWPYTRSALKNRQRWTFGGVYPRGHSEGREDDPWTMRMQCLLRGGNTVELDVRVRFLHVVRRQLLDRGRPVDELTVGGERHLSWEEATERELQAPPDGVTTLSFPAGSEEEVLGPGASVVRSWEALEGHIEVGVERLSDDLQRVSVEVANTSPWPGGSREAAQARTFCSTHAVLRATSGEFVSLTDPPDELRTHAEACSNEGVWPVLVGEPHERGTLLASPIILEDHPRIASESPGDLFDGGEIDQMLVLNILSLSEEEKAEMRASDPKAREILDRTEALSEEEMMSLHGAVRDLRHVRGS
ncbi:MAG TPA: hypothetical protein VK304_02765 [Thermoleophilaceae bacterium]|nr:hypothetical protein [Thermoleophilaceae bacterium]